MKKSSKVLRWRRLTVLIPLAILVTALPQAAASQPGVQCTEDVRLVNDVGCAAPCCAEDPPHSGHYVFMNQSVEKIDIRSNSANVLSVSFPNLRSIEKGARISYNQPGSITKVSFPVLATAGGLDITSNPGLVEIDLPRLSTIENVEYDAYLKVQSNEALTTLNVPLLDQVVATDAGSAYVQIRSNNALEEIDFPILRTIEALDDYGEAYLFIDGNDGVRSIVMDDLRRLSAGAQSISYVVIYDLPALEELSFSQLTEILPTGDVNDFSELTVGNTPKLTDLAFPSLERVTVLQLVGLKGARRAMFPRLAELDYLWTFRNCSDAESSLKMYICSGQPIGDLLFGNDDGLCGPAGYMLHSSNPENEAACDANSFCESFTPETTECQCGAVGLCVN